MPKKFDPKSCVICSNVFTPTSASQIVCENIDCKTSYRRARDKVRYKRDRGTIVKACSSCGNEFVAKNTRRTVCYTPECELNLKRSCLSLYREKEKLLNPKIDKSVMTKEYFSSFGYSADMSTYTNGRSKIKVTCPSGHEYLTCFSNFKSGFRCSKCSGNIKKTIEEVKIEFASEGIDVLQEHYVNNNVKIKCRCINRHDFSISRANFLSGKGCPFCWAQNRKKGLSAVRAEFEKEGYKVLQDYYELADNPIKCVCPEGHETTLTWSKFNIGRRCKVCSTEAKKLGFEEVKKAFNDRGYILEQDFYENLQTAVKCICPNGHSSYIRPSGFIYNGHGCGECAVNDRKHPLEYVRDTFTAAGYVMEQDFYTNAAEHIKCTCPNGHTTGIAFSRFLSGSRCGKCHPVRSRPEIEVCSYVESLGVEVVPNDRTMIKPKELDVYVPSKKVAIEYCGFYWHCEKTGEKPKSYHYDKMISCAEAGIRLVTIFEDEWVNRRDVVESRIKNALGMSERRVFARKCTVSELSFMAANDFLSKYHLQGKSNSNKRWGLFLDGELLQVITVGNLSRAHTGKGGKYLELKRFASLPGVSVVGGASKLFKMVKEYAVENGYTHIKSYCDMRYANYAKPVYESLGFELSHFTRYTPHYVRGEERFRNQGLCKTEEERLTGKTEWELREEQGYDRIWDCGHRTYVMQL